MLVSPFAKSIQGQPLASVLAAEGPKLPAWTLDLVNLDLTVGQSTGLQLVPQHSAMAQLDPAQMTYTGRQHAAHL
jgi:hypothetical protein